MSPNLTLQQGLDSFRNKNKKYFNKRNYSVEGKAFLKSHDISHVVFGCNTTLYGEGIVKVWTTFGTTLSFWKIVSGYKEASAFELFREYSTKHIFQFILKLLRDMPTAIIRAKKMNKPWPFNDYEKYLNVPIGEIRKEYNINILSS